MKKIGLILLLQFAALTFIFGQRGKIIYFDFVETMTAQEIRDLYDSQGIPSVLLTVDYGVSIYKVKYETLDFDGVTPLNATGLVAIPTDYPCDMALMSFGHGLTLKNGGVATGSPNNPYRLISLGLA